MTRFEKVITSYKVFYSVDEKEECQDFRSDLRVQLQKRLDIHDKIAPLKSMEEILRVTIAWTKQTEFLKLHSIFPGEFLYTDLRSRRERELLRPERLVLL